MELCLCLFHYFPYGGLQRDFLKIAQLALEKGYHVSCYAISWEGSIPHGLELHLLPAQGCSNHAKCRHFAQLLGEVLAEKKYDCVLGFNRLPHLDFYFAADVCFQMSSRQKHPVASRFLSRYRIFNTLEKAVFAPDSKTRILYLTRQQKSDYQKIYHTPSERFHLISPGIVLPQKILSQTQARQLLNLPIPPQARWLLMVAHQLKTKGIDRNLKALAKLPAILKKNTHLLVVGKEGIVHYRRMANQLGISSQVHFLGEVDNVNLLMQASDILVHPALQEAAGMVLVEALVNHLPVLTTDNCGYAYHIQEAQAGLVVSSHPFSETDFIKALVELLNQTPNTFYREHAKTYVQQVELSKMAEQVLDAIFLPKTIVN